MYCCLLASHTNCRYLPVMLKEQISSLSDASLNIYDTCVTPTIKVSPGLCDLNNVGITPLLSTAVGSIHVAVLEDVPRGTVSVVDWGHPVITGGTVSTSVTIKL